MSVDVAPKRTREVLGYFLHHPRAADSLEGVARWRLREEAIHRSVDEINAALVWLVAQGFLVEKSASGARAVFSLNPRRIADAACFMDDDEGHEAAD